MSTKTIIQFLLFISMSLSAIAIGVSRYDKKMNAPRPELRNVPLPLPTPLPFNVSGDWEGTITRVAREGPEVGFYLEPSDPPSEEYLHYWPIESASGDSYRVLIPLYVWRNGRCGDLAKRTENDQLPEFTEVNFRDSGVPRWKDRATVKPCKRCGSKYVLDIVWGLPASDYFMEYEDEIFFGGCMPGPATKACNACNLWW